MSSEHALIPIAEPSNDGFSLIDRPWLPVRRVDGTRLYIRPAEITSEIATNPIVAIDWSRPDFDAAAREFLIGLLATACTARLGDQWRQWFDQPPTPEMLDQSFARLCPAFLLDGPGPCFLQDIQDLDGEEVPIAQLLIDSPGANALKKNLDHFIRRGRVDTVSRAAATIALFTLQDYAPTGGAGHRTSLRGGGPLTTLVVPGPPSRDIPVPLWQMLWLNAVAEGDGEDEIALERIFPWLAATRVSNEDHATTPGDVHSLQAYWGMPRRIRLIFEPNTQALACGLTGLVDSVIVRSYRTRPYGAKYAAFRHPLSPHYRQKPTDAQWLPVHGQPGRIGYRHWIGLVEKQEGDLRRPAQAVTTAQRRLRSYPEAVRRNARFTAAGYDMDNMKARQFIESEMPLHLAAETVAGQVKIVVEQLVNGAREAAQLLSRQLRIALFGPNAPSDASVLVAARDRLWEATEALFHRRLADLVDALERGEHGEAGRSRQEWLGAVRSRVLEIFDASAPLAQLDALGITQVERIIGARRSLTLALAGYGKAGGVLYATMGLAQPEARRKLEHGGAR